MTGPTPLVIAGREVARGRPVYIVAEMSANHRQDLSEAVRILSAAGDCGADAVKLQTYRPETITIDCDNEYFRIHGTPWGGKTLYALYEEAATPWEWYPKLREAAEAVGLHLFSTPFDDAAVDFLEEMGAPAYKVASFELVDLALLRRIAATGKPVILSTGMATLDEISEAVEALRGAGGRQIALLKCTSAYPAPAEEMNLLGIRRLEERFHVPVGLSDHTLDPRVVPSAAVALGACIVEKHMTLSRVAGGPDAAFSLEPHEFRQMVHAVRTVERALGSGSLEPSAREAENRVFRRSLFVIHDVRAGEAFTAGNVRSIRPGHGLHPRHLDQVLGRAATRDIPRGTPLAWDMVGGEPVPGRAPSSP